MKSRSLIRRGLLATTALMAAGGGILVAAGTAGASNKEVTTAGSFTTYALMHALFPDINDLYPGNTTANQIIASTTAQCNGGLSFATPQPSTTHLTHFSPPSTAKPGAPNGSTAGKKFMDGTEQRSGIAATRKGCIDFTRSSSPPKGTGGGGTPKQTGGPTDSFDYYAYALTGITVVLGGFAGGSETSPTEVTLTQLREIYSCWNGTSNVYTWTQAGLGTAAGSHKNTDINRFWPQTGSGTQSTYKDILGFTPVKTHSATSKVHCTTDPVGRAIQTLPSVTSTHPPVSEENSEESMIYADSITHCTHKLEKTTNTVAGTCTWRTINNDIYIYSTGKYVGAWNTQTNFGPTHPNSLTSTAIGNFTRTQSPTAGTAAYTTGRSGRTLRLAALKGTTAHTKKYLYATFFPTGTTGLYSIDGTTINEANEWYHHLAGNSAAPTTSTAVVPGVRYLFNALDTLIPTYDGAKNLVAFNNVSPTTLTGHSPSMSALCRGDLSSVIEAQGFIPLGSTDPTTSASGSTLVTSNKAGSTCREFPGTAYPGWAPTSTYRHWTLSHYVQPTG